MQKMSQKLKQLIKELLFLTPSERATLISSLDSFSEQELKEMHGVFSSLKNQEKLFMKKIFSQNPEFEDETKSLLVHFGAAHESTKHMAKSLTHLEKIIKKIK